MKAHEMELEEITPEEMAMLNCLELVVVWSRTARVEEMLQEDKISMLSELDRSQFTLNGSRTSRRVEDR